MDIWKEIEDLAVNFEICHKTLSAIGADMESFNHLINTLRQSIDICRMLPDRSGEN